MKRKLIRYCKYIVLFVVVVTLILSSSLSHEKQTNKGNFSGRYDKSRLFELMDYNPDRGKSDVEPSTFPNITPHREVVEDVDAILKQWEPRFKSYKKKEHKNVVNKNTLNKTNIENTTGIITKKNQKIKNDTDYEFNELLQETAKRLKENGVIKIKNAGADSVYILRRTGKKTKITKTGPLFPSNPVNDYNISYLIPNKYACSGDPKVFILTLVFNQHTEERYRRIVREYWGKARIVRGKRIQHIFLLGRTNSLILQRRTEQESRKFKDIVQGDFLDTYKNLTLKTLMGFQWIRDFCQEATFMLKVDSDIIVNYLSLVRHLSASPTNGFVEGHVQRSFPSRKKYSKWYTPEEEYPEPTYAPYVVGPSYLMSSDVSTKVLEAAPFVRFLPWEDAYVGLVLKKLNITNVNSKGYIVQLKGQNLWSNICAIQKYFTFYVGRELDEKRVRFIVDGWHQKLNFCKNR